jgi:hypothetical protein
VANGAKINTTTPGTHSFSVTATDNAARRATETVTYTVTGLVVSSPYESHRMWHEPGKPSDGKPAGTTFTFTLSSPMEVTLTFTRHRSKHKLQLNGNRGTNTVKFNGKLADGKRLAPGKYTLTITAPGANTVTLKFTIVA